MKFSVLIPVYNTEKYLDECIQSVLNQTYRDFEIILVDDGSTDSSPQMCDEYQVRFPKIIKVIHQKNSGQLVSRINAINASAGDYCLFLDSDDLIVDTALETICNKAESYSYPDMMIYPFYYDRDGDLKQSRMICKEEKYFSVSDIGSLRESFFADILLNNVWTKAVKREVLLHSILDYNAFTSLRCAEDRLHAMWILDSIHSALYINLPLYRYRLFHGSITRTYTIESISKYNTVILFEEEKKYLIKWGFDTPDWIARFKARYINDLIYIFDLFYINVKKNEKKLVIGYSWLSFIPEGIAISSLKDNNYLSDVRKQLLMWILDKDEKSIKKYYFKKRVYQRIRQMKRKVFK